MRRGGMDRKVVLVTGGTSGIGLGVVGNLLEQGGWQILSFSRSRAGQEKAERSLGGKGAEVIFLEGDICDEDRCRRLAQQIESMCGGLHGLVNCAGTISANGIENEPLEEWNRVMSVNLTGPYIITKALIPLLRKASGATIVNISSVCSLRPCPSISYSVSKAGLDMFTKCVAKDLARYGIRVNSINPGVVKSNLQLSAGAVKDYDSFLEKMKSFHPLGRTGLPKDIAGMVRFLLSEQASWITGAIISIDGGRAI
jgi:NAD(P)-dependent dehydrogenase (short-subunit alcohol dehydrogenase family)